MLSGDILSQLSNLKKDIRASRDVAQGSVRGTSGRYGFVSLDDGRDVFLAPDQMDRVFHGDRVEVLVETSVSKKEGQEDKEQAQAKLEKLIHSPLKQLAGRYCIKGKGHFVIVEYPQHSRWIFVPPNARNGAKEGHYVTARITQHPYQTGKSQAKVISDLGTDPDINMIRQYTLALYQLFDGFGKEVMEQSKSIQAQAPVASSTDHTGRSDLRDLAFVTIDSAGTRDMDDALCIRPTDDGWELRVAIADPSSEIEWESPLDHIALLRANSVYLPGKPVPMLPDTLSTERYSLVSGQDRLALVVTLHIDQSGDIKGYQFESAIIQSKAKLSYQQVSALLNNHQFNIPEQLDDAEPFREQLMALQDCANARQQFRQTHQIVGQHRPDFMLVLNDQGKLESIEKLEKNNAHLIVEEAMLATNQCAGEFLAKYQAGLFSVQSGYRTERREDIEKLLKEKLGDEKVTDITDLNNFIGIIKYLQENDVDQLLSKQQRFQQSSELDLNPSPHFGMGIKHYANITSPIRRFQDLYNHRIIHALLEGKKPVKLRQKQVERLKEAINNNRNATRAVEQWLIADYMQAKIGETFKGYIALLTNQGVGIRLIDSGIEGFIAATKENKNEPEKPFDKISFNNQRMELTWNSTELHLDQEVEVKLSHVDMEKKKPIFEWVNKP